MIYHQLSALWPRWEQHLNSPTRLAGDSAPICRRERLESTFNFEQFRITYITNAPSCCNRSGRCFGVYVLKSVHAVTHCSSKNRRRMGTAHFDKMKDAINVMLSTHANCSLMAGFLKWHWNQTSLFQKVWCIVYLQGRWAWTVMRKEYRWMANTNTKFPGKWSLKTQTDVLRLMAALLVEYFLCEVGLKLFRL